MCGRELSKLLNHNLLTAIFNLCWSFHASKVTNKPPISFTALCVCDHLGTWPVLYMDTFFIILGLMTSLNISVFPIYSFLTDWIDCFCWLHKNISKCFRLPLLQNTGPDSELCCRSSQQSVDIFFSSCSVGYGKVQFLLANHSLLEWLFLLFSPLTLICKSRCIWVCINWFIACLSWKTLQVTEYAKNTSFLKSLPVQVGSLPSLLTSTS